jgi:membrane-associated phospholipid phosphatase
VRRSLVAVGLALAAAGAVAGAARAQVPASNPDADSLAPDSAFRRAGPVLRWNVVTRELVGRDLAARQGRRARATFYDGNNNTRLYALVSGAQYDALRAATRDGEGDMAAAAAAAAVLGTVFPREAAYLARQLAGERKRLGGRGLPPASIRAGEQVGQAAARRWRADATRELRVPPWRGTAPSGPGRWHSEGGPPSLAISLGLRPWFLVSRDQFRPPPPPAPDSPDFAAALAVVRTATQQRTRAETRATWTWARNAATLWNEIAGQVVLRNRLPEAEAARALMYLNMALSDATIACWDAKLTYWLARPSQVDPNLDLSVPLPNFPAYPSAHATLFAAGAAVLGHLVPAERAALDSLAREATMSRLWAGVHYPFDNEAGARLGRQVAEAALNVLDAEDGSGPRAVTR